MCVIILLCVWFYSNHSNNSWFYNWGVIKHTCSYACRVCNIVHFHTIHFRELAYTPCYNVSKIRRIQNQNHNYILINCPTLELNFTLLMSRWTFLDGNMVETESVTVCTHAAHLILPHLLLDKVDQHTSISHG